MQKAIEIDDVNEPEAFDHMKDADRAALLAWVQQNLTPSEHYYDGASSYGLKHIYEDLTRRYVTNGEFKGAMLAAGFVPKDRSARNWSFKIVRPMVAMQEAGYAGL